MTAKKLLVITKHPPVAHLIARETLELVLLAASLDWSVSLLLCDEGVWQLAALQPDEKLYQPMANLMSALPHYDLAHLYVERESWLVRNLDSAVVTVPFELISCADIASMSATQDLVLTG